MNFITFRFCALLILLCALAGCAEKKSVFVPGTEGKTPLRLNIPTETYRLKNGLHVMLVKREINVEFAAKFIFYTGVKDEPVGKNGIRFLAFATRFMPYEDCARTAEAAGLWFDPFNIQGELTALDLVGDRNNLEVALALYARQFDAAQMTREKFNNTKNEILDDFPPVSQEASLEGILYEGQPYGRSGIGSRKETETVTFEECQQWAETYLNISCAHLCIIGSFDSAKTKELIEKHFGKFPAGKIPPEPDWNFTPLQGPKLREVQAGDPGERRFTYAWETPGAGNEDEDELTLLPSWAMDQLFKETVQQCKINPNVSVRWMNHWGPSYLILQFRAAEDEADKVEKLMLEAFENLKTRNVEMKELDEVKEGMLKGILYPFTSPYHASWWHPAPLRDFFDVNYKHVDKVNRIMNLSPKALQDVLAKYSVDQRLFKIVNHPRNKK